MKLKYCQEEIPFEQALSGLVEVGMENILVHELGKALLYQKNFETYQVPKPGKTRIRELVEEFLKQNNIKDHQALGEWLKAKKSSRQSLTKRLVYQEQLRILKQLVIPSTIIQDEFLKRKHQMDWVLFAAIQVTQESLIWELYYQLKDDGYEFEQLARQYSIAAGASFGGVEEPVQVDTLASDIRNRVIHLKPGEITEPFTTDGKNYLILRLLRLHSTQLTPQIDVRMREELFAEWTNRMLALGNLQLESDTSRYDKQDSKEFATWQ